ncbi:MAG: TIGR03905 family TSCPD domain-containing protein [Clostridia bacterium]|nr:TIGR03905 family TSCPD domain-containing protein [Clostridia bacterium]
MITEYTNKGVCSRKTVVELDENDTILNVSIVGGCNGNLQGIASLLKGMKAQEAIKRIEGINCNGRGTSCPDQVAKALKKAIEENK